MSQEKTVKITLVGDPCSGKTLLCQKYARGRGGRDIKSNQLFYEEKWQLKGWSDRKCNDLISSMLEMGDLRNVNIVVVGDGSVGKTCVCTVYVKKTFPANHVPTIFEAYQEQLSVDGENVSMLLNDTAGQEDYKDIRVLCYPNTDVFICCFSVADKVTFHNVEAVWLPEVKDKVPKAKILLVGTKADLRGTNQKSGGSQRNKEVGKKSIARLVTRHGLDGYMEVSALKSPEDVDRMITKAVRLGLDLKQNVKNTEGETGVDWKACFAGCIRP